VKENENSGVIASNFAKINAITFSNYSICFPIYFSAIYGQAFLIIFILCCSGQWWSLQVSKCGKQQAFITIQTVAKPNHIGQQYDNTPHEMALIKW